MSCWSLIKTTGNVSYFTVTVITNSSLHLKVLYRPLCVIYLHLQHDSNGRPDPGTVTDPVPLCLHGNLCVFQVLNGLAADSPRLQRFCGTVPAGTQVRSSGNTMTVVFRTDAEVSNGGFTASYSSDEPAGKN